MSPDVDEIPGRFQVVFGECVWLLLWLACSAMKSGLLPYKERANTDYSFYSYLPQTLIRC